MIRPPHLPRSSEAPKTATLRGSKMRAMEMRGDALAGMASATPEHGLALLEHRADALLGVLGAVDQAVPALRQQHGAVRGVAILRAHDLLDRADRQRRAARELVRDAPDLLVEGLIGEYAGYQPPVVRLLSADIVAEQRRVERPVAAEIMHEARVAEAPARCKAQIDVSGAELRGGGGEPDVARPGDRRAAADAPTAHRGDHRLRMLLDQVDHPHADLAHGGSARGICLAAAFQVSAGAERVGSRAADEDGASVVTPPQRLERRDDLLEKRLRQEVERRPVD